MIKLVIFDLDGTFLDTIADLAESTNQALRRHGFPAHPEGEKKALRRYISSRPAHIYYICIFDNNISVFANLFLNLQS
jgi:phosphoglycolate phosphatase-like HAD superfamily hydrolase